MLDGLLGSMMSGMMGGQSAQGAQGGNPMIQMALQMLQQNGGIEGVLAKFQQAGMGQQAQSWIGTGHNMHWLWTFSKQGFLIAPKMRSRS